MSRKYKFYNKEGVYFVSFATLYNDLLKIFNSYNNINEKEVESDESDKSLELTANIDTKIVKYEDKYIELLKNMSLIDNDNVKQLPKKHNMVMEYTPLGNVIMFYDDKTESFHYNSDTTIPYRFLEVVARKYILTFHCKQLYVDMEEEIKLAIEKIDIEKQLKITAQQQIIDSNNNDKTTTSITNSNSKVFAKFKDYNKNNTKTSSTVPNKSNNQSNQNKKDDEILKENANRYTYDGRFSNFQFLIKVDKKITDKRLGLTFADFKKMNK